jgi:hypothetical protein
MYSTAALTVQGSHAIPHNCINAEKWHHAGLTAPDGLCIHFWGPYEGHRHDSTVFAASKRFAYFEENNNIFAGKAIVWDPATHRASAASRVQVRGLINAPADFQSRDECCAHIGGMEFQDHEKYLGIHLARNSQRGNERTFERQQASANSARSDCSVVVAHSKYA